MQNLFLSSLRTKLSLLVFLFSAISFSLSAQNCVEECECEGGLEEMTLYYFGDVNADVRVYGDLQQTQLIDQFAVSNGDDFTVSAAGLAGGYFPYYLYFEVDDGMGNECTAKIFAYCPSLIWPLSEEDLEIRGKSYGDLMVYSYRSQAGNVCDLNDSSIEQDWRVGGNLVGTDNNRLGTLNNEDLSLITGNVEQAVLTQDGNFGIGTSTPSNRLEVNGRSVLQNNGNAVSIVGEDHVFLELSPNGGAAAARLGYLNSGSSDLSLQNISPSGDLTLISDEDIFLDSENVGLGVATPATKLHVEGNRIRLSAEGQLSRYLEFNTDAAENEINSNSENLSINGPGLSLNATNDDLTINALGPNSLLLNSNSIFLNGQGGPAQVAVNTTDTPGNHSLYVGGTIIAEEVIVKLQMNWPDYVFGSDHPRPNIREWERFIAEHQHLPGMPSAAEIAESDGVAIGETQQLLLEKIEELTLLLIDQQNEIDALKALIEED